MMWIQTSEGGRYSYGEGQKDITIEDIAVGLSRISRFLGRTKETWSVAQHSILVSKMLGAMGCSYDVQLRGLMHDAHEAFTGDMVSPLKRYAPAIADRLHAIQDAVDRDIYLALDLPWRTTDAEWAEVKKADEAALHFEQTLFEDRLDWGLRYLHWLDDETANIAAKEIGKAGGANVLRFVERFRTLYRKAEEHDWAK